MTISPARNERYLYRQDTSVSFIGPTTSLIMINMPHFNILLGADNTLAGTFHYEEGNSTGQDTSKLTPLVWVSVATIAVVAGLFPNGQKGFNFPTSLANPLWITGAEACRLRFEHTAGGAAGQLNVVYHGKSLG